MKIGAVGVQPYVYNTNSISSASMNKIKGIGSDLTSSKTDFSNLASEKVDNENPLKMGETKNFADVLNMQMEMGRMNSFKVMDVSPFENQAVRNVSENDQTSNPSIQSVVSAVQGSI